ncbi:MAG TPA: hypothetical protein ENG69_01435 [Candidatus Korarchaeota archaeon]|nr:hypothetical protein [Candidatus Korarchaeota archaeon]
MIFGVILFTSIVLLAVAIYGLISRDNPVKMLISFQLMTSGGIGIFAALLISGKSTFYVQSGQTLGVLLVATDLTTEAILLAALLTMVKKLGIRRLNDLSRLRG